MDTVQEALNNSFTLVIQSFLTLVGTMTMLCVLSLRLTLIVVVFLVLMFPDDPVQQQERKEILQEAAGVSGKHQRLCGGNGGRPETLR